MDDPFKHYYYKKVQVLFRTWSSHVCIVLMSIRTDVTDITSLSLSGQEIKPTKTKHKHHHRTKTKGRHHHKTKHMKHSPTKKHHGHKTMVNKYHFSPNEMIKKINITS